MPDYGKSLFEGTANYFAKYRPIYPSGVIRLLVNRFQLDGTGSLLDIGSGTGQLTYRYTDWFESVIGLDVQPEMIQEAKRLSAALRLQNVQWVEERIEAFLKHNQELNFRLVTMAKAFHWMDREALLNQLYTMIQPGGGIAVIDVYEPELTLEPWQKVMEAVVNKWYGGKRRAGETTFKTLEKRHEQVIDESPFELEIHQLAPSDYTWTIESIIGHHYSTSYGAKRYLGENVEAFEKDLANALMEVSPEGIFKEKKTVSIILGIKGEQI